MILIIYSNIYIFIFILYLYNLHEAASEPSSALRFPIFACLWSRLERCASYMKYATRIVNRCEPITEDAVQCCALCEVLLVRFLCCAVLSGLG